MSPLRTPQSLSEPVHTDTGEAMMKFELLEELEACARSGDVARAQRALPDVSSEAQTVLDHVRLAVDGGVGNG